jgi:sec-independent protein translocase protein TatA
MLRPSRGGLSWELMFQVGPLELLVVGIIALLVLGPARLPDAAKAMGRGMREFRSALDGGDDDDDRRDRKSDRDSDPDAV